MIALLITNIVDNEVLHLLPHVPGRLNAVKEFIYGEMLFTMLSDMKIMCFIVAKSTTDGKLWTQATRTISPDPSITLVIA